MNKISCEVCMDLIPLVQDGAASDDSRQAVKSHTTQCAHCRTLIVQTSVPPHMNEQRVLFALKQKLAAGALILIVIGAFLGVGLSDGQAVFYNILIMPAIGMLGYVALRRKAFLTPIVLFIFAYVMQLVQLFMRGGSLEESSAVLFWAVIYGVLCALGTTIAALLHFAFRKDESSYEG